MTTYQPNVVLATEEYEIIGKRPVRPDGVDKVTGRALYGADFSMPGQLHARVLRSPHAHAHIRSIDVSGAQALPGVKAVVTAKDVFDGDAVQEAPSLRYLRSNILARDKALYQGHAIAAVAAVSAHVAEEALALIDVKYEPLPPVLSALDSMSASAPLLHEDLTTNDLGQAADRPSNVSEHIQFKLGDIEAGFQNADVVIEREFSTATLHQGYIEPHNATALWNKDGRVTIWCSHQGAFLVRDLVSQVLGLPVSRIKVVPMEIGGGFGGKLRIYQEPLAALLSKKSGQPVKMVMSRAEVFHGTGPAPGTHIKLKMGATNDGRITAAQANLIYESGAFPGSPLAGGAKCALAAYDIDNVLIDGLEVVVNKPRTGAYRAPGATHAVLATESVIDEMAEMTGIDGLEFRIRNAAKEGSRRADGVTYPRIGCLEVLEAMRDHPHYSAPLDGPNRGRGVAIGFWSNAGLQSSVNLSVNSDGVVSLIEGCPDIGGTRASLAMQAAEALGIPYEDVHPTVVDTDSVGYNVQTGGSRVTFATGWAVWEAAQDVKRQMMERASIIWDVDLESVELERGVFKSKEDPELQMTFKELAAQLGETGGPVTGRGAVDPKGVGASFAGNIVDVEVDPDTGKVQVLRFTAVQDAGKAIHPSYVENQMQGGAVQGIGWALNEEYFYNDDGSLANESFLDYRMPTSLDVPMIDTVIVEVASPGHPFGVRGVGEVPIVPPPAAMANAVYGATGVRIRELPMNPAAVMRAMGGHSNGQPSAPVG